MHRKLGWLISFLCAMVIFIAMFCVYRFNSIDFFVHGNRPVDIGKGVPRYQPAKPNSEIVYFVYDYHYKGQNVLSIEADRLSLQKNKIGLIRFGLLKEMFLQNAKIDFYKITSQGSNITPKITSQSSNLEPMPTAQAQAATYFDSNRFSLVKAFALLPSQRVVSYEFEPVKINFHESNEVVSSIVATRAIVRASEQSIVFNGTVVLETGNKVIRTSQLSLKPESSEISITKPYTLLMNKKIMKGTRLSSDIFLSSINL